MRNRRTPPLFHLPLARSLFRSTWMLFLRISLPASFSCTTSSVSGRVFVTTTASMVAIALSVAIAGLVATVGVVAALTGPRWGTWRLFQRPFALGASNTRHFTRFPGEWRFLVCLSFSGIISFFFLWCSSNYFWSKSLWFIFCFI